VLRFYVALICVVIARILNPRLLVSEPFAAGIQRIYPIESPNPCLTFSQVGDTRTGKRRAGSSTSTSPHSRHPEALRRMPSSPGMIIFEPHRLCHLCVSANSRNSRLRTGIRTGWEFNSSGASTPALSLSCWTMFDSTSLLDRWDRRAFVRSTPNCFALILEHIHVYFRVQRSPPWAGQRPEINIL
jgi:hypothetical protein